MLEAPGASALVLGVDVGTTSTKVNGYTAGTVDLVVSASAGYPLLTPRPDVAEQDADIVRDAALSAIADCVRTATERGLEVAGLSFSAAMHSLLGVDADGRPLTKLLTWADSRSDDQAQRLRVAGEGLAMHRRTGTPVHPMSPLVKLRWFAEQEPDVAGQVRRWLGIKEYLLAVLVDGEGDAGDPVVDAGIASGTGLYNLADASWDAEALHYASIPASRLPRPVPTTTVLRLADGAAAQLGLPSGLPVVIGGADGPLANLGLGAVRPGSVACSIGTSGAVRASVDAPNVDERGRVFCYNLAPGRFVIGGAVNNGGLVLDWLRDAVAPDLADDHPQALLDLAATAPVGSNGLLFLPYLLGERAPHWSAVPRAAFLGLTREHRREHLARAALEGVCLQLGVVLASLGNAGVDVHEIRATGGFARSPLWRRILVDVFGRPVGFAASPEGSSLGAALLGMTALGLLESLDRAADLVQIASVEKPTPDDADAYARLQPIFEQAYDSLAPVFAALHDLPG
ncbi:MAG: gluconokinase [Frankiaceae bacterium]|nr:gluconokinase [Frankiaceae bacterium]